MQDVSGEVEGARASFREGLRLNPGYAQLYHAFARLEGKLANWGALQVPWLDLAAAWLGSA